MTDTAKGHPQALYRLFFTEMWERFSFYGMRGLLVLFMVDSIKHGGLGLDDKTATAIYGIYTGLVYFASLPGGWVADRILGARTAIWRGGILIACGHFILALPWKETFFGGLALVVIGTGLLKPNISAMVGQLYAEGDQRRDAGFTIFYMGINLGAALGPLVCGALGESPRFGWHYGFAAAGVGMIAGLIQYRMSFPQLAAMGNRPPPERALAPKAKFALLGLPAVGVVAFALAMEFGVVRLNAPGLADKLSTFIAFLGLIYFALLLTTGKLSRDEGKRVAVIFLLFVASAIFWAGFEQAGSSFNLFAERYTTRAYPSISAQEIPASWFQSLGPVFIITLAPVMAAIWVRLARANREPSVPVKFGVGLLFLGLGFLVMSWASNFIANGAKVGAQWLTMTYLIHTIGELCLSPVGLSSVTKLAPPRLVGRMMGTWFLATSLGNILAGQIAGHLGGDAVAEMPGRYLSLAIIPAILGLLLVLCAKPILRWTRHS